MISFAGKGRGTISSVTLDSIQQIKLNRLQTPPTSDSLPDNKKSLKSILQILEFDDL